MKQQGGAGGRGSRLGLVACFWLVGCGGIQLEPSKLTVSDLAIHPCAQAETQRLPPSERRSECFIVVGKANNAGAAAVRNVNLYGIIVDAQGITIKEGRIGSVKDMRARSGTHFSVRVLFPRDSVHQPLRLETFRARGLT